ncbi:hypothetical protein ACXC9Q_02270 [Kribbella sp. CWNU-51]
MPRGVTTLLNQHRETWSALPDGSIPFYGSYPLPGMPGGGPPLAAFGWGPELDDDREYSLGHGEPLRRGLVIGLLVICSLVIAGMATVLATRRDDSPPAPPRAAAQLSVAHSNYHPPAPQG